MKKVTLAKLSTMYAKQTNETEAIENFFQRCFDMVEPYSMLWNLGLDRAYQITIKNKNDLDTVFHPLKLHNFPMEQFPPYNHYIELFFHMYAQALKLKVFVQTRVFFYVDDDGVQCGVFVIADNSSAIIHCDSFYTVVSKHEEKLLRVVLPKGISNTYDIELIEEQPLADVLKKRLALARERLQAMENERKKEIKMSFTRIQRYKDASIKINETAQDAWLKAWLSQPLINKEANVNAVLFTNNDKGTWLRHKISVWSDDGTKKKKKRKRRKKNRKKNTTSIANKF